uniref:GOLD domain-containing protein n=1 Tax=Rhodosorus marinus TaxID=101924 RepID=A0A7S2ZQ58_9RHOD|mmetsp:Transcript_24944/g.98491  ORF Transcript_24944/g.98491 Transcript_24944/m.98491 type:complete len:216 (+) Transcript_24944:892-1539(+)|eukprot:CAMPEP_0113953764 /NCGR_PEP_ID=MMETSP0011_2-20120614/27_1 /TAXON_ID=101924 /ORGANISM="Rhodosorus marinus" /LENGTH=215 /DNA_ID=CAMNT_0000962515 /DNA_START=568 /DNA_END=1215 /DNA_ORIENTATION=- /assembly_acc=CAM_ASM_000156
MKVVIGVVGLFWSVGLVTGFAFDLYGDKQECFTQELHAKEDLSLSYAIEKGTSGVTVVVTDPSGVAIFTEPDKKQGKFHFRSGRNGAYKICFTYKATRFNKVGVDLILRRDPFSTTEDAGDGGTGAVDETIDRLTKSSQRLAKSVGMFEFQQSRHRQLYEKHSEVVQRTNFRVKFWTFCECLAILLISVGQIYLMRKALSGTSANFSKSGKRLNV